MCLCSEDLKITLIYSPCPLCSSHVDELRGILMQRMQFEMALRSGPRLNVGILTGWDLPTATKTHQM